MLHCCPTQVPSLDVAVPMHLKGLRARHNSLTEESENLNFVVMLKKGNKQQYKGNQSFVNLPVDLMRDDVTRPKGSMEVVVTLKSKMAAGSLVVGKIVKVRDL